MRYSATLAFRIVLGLVASAALTACGDDAPDRPDAGRIDGGRSDAGPPIDAAPLDDAAPDEDASAEDAGVDAGGCAVDCSTIEVPPCMTSVCGAAGECVMMPLPDATTCDDGNFCTVGEACAAGACTGGAPNDCAGMTAPQCQEIYCDATAGACRARAATAMNGMACTYPDLCVTGTTCSAGLCSSGVRRDCTATPVSGQCQAPSCNPTTGECQAVSAREGLGCTDPANPCIVDNTCTAGTCGGGTMQRDCSAMNATCAVGVCNPTSGSCMAMPAAEGSTCDDGMSCTSGTVCTSGLCAGGTAPACSLTRDGCCPGSCTESNDADCGCPGEFVGTTCVYLPSTAAVADQPAATTACSALGTGWGLCTSALLCSPQILTYLATEGIGCSGGAGTGACGSAANVYVHVDGPSSPFYVRGPAFPGCLTTNSCTVSVSEDCGVPLCCR